MKVFGSNLEKNDVGSYQQLKARALDSDGSQSLHPQELLNLNKKKDQGDNSFISNMQ